MTTVGYGDSVPKTICARIFTVMWIMMGIIALSALTATFANQMHEARHPPTPTMTGKAIGAMRHRTFEGAIIAEGGGVLVDVEDNNDDNYNYNYNSIFQLIRLLRRGKIDGFVLDRYTYIILCTYMDSKQEYNPKYSEDVKYMKTRTIQTEKKYNGQKLSLGVLVRDDDVYNYFAEFILGNGILINVCCALMINDIQINKGVQVRHMEKEEIFSINSGLFWPTFIVATGVLVFICCFGLLYEIQRRQRKNERHWKRNDGEPQIRFAFN